jgi:hypothetical protein
MLNLQLKLRPEIAQRLEKILGYTHDQESFVQNIIAYQITELKKGNLIKQGFISGSIKNGEVKGAFYS